MPNNGDKIDWASISAYVEGQHPHLKDQVHDMTGFVEKWSGGPDGRLLKDLDAWSRSLKTKCDVSGKDFKLLAQAALTDYPDVVASMVKAAFRSPENYQRAGVSTLLTGSDIANLSGTNKALTIELQTMVKACREFWRETLKKSDLISETDYNIIVGELQVRSIHAIFNKKPKGRAHFNKLDRVAQQFNEDLICKNAAFEHTMGPFGTIERTKENKDAVKASGFRTPRD